MYSCSKRAVCGKKWQKTLKNIVILGNGPLKGILLGEHGFMKQPINAKTNLGAVFFKQEEKK